MVTQEIYKDDSGKLVIKVSESGDSTLVTLEGESISENPGKFLDPVFEEIFHDISQNYVMNLTNMKYMNSASMTPLIRLFQRMEKGDGGLVMQFDGTKKWQNLSFDALVFFKTKDGRIDIVPEN